MVESMKVSIVAVFWFVKAVRTSFITLQKKNADLLSHPSIPVLFALFHTFARHSMERDDDDDIEGQLNPFNNVPSAAGGPVSLPLLPPPEEQQRVLHDAGYRDGASAGHALGLQEGFDEGFGEGIKAGEALGRLLGAAR